MRSSAIRGLAVGLIAFAGVTGCGAPRNCVVIPLQIDLVKQRRDAALTELENGAKQVDRVRATIEQARVKVLELEQEKALLDSLNAVRTR
jgi:hypothetical protein